MSGTVLVIGGLPTRPDRHPAGHSRSCHAGLPESRRVNINSNRRSPAVTWCEVSPDPDRETGRHD
jgi:hypothetical protein